MHGHSPRGLRHPRLYDFLIHLTTRGREDHYREQLLTLARIAAGQRVLDIGCGTGTTAIAAWRRVQPGGAVYGIDVSPEMIAAARRKAARALAGSLQFQTGEAVCLPFQDTMFDTVLITTVLHMIAPDQRAAVLREACRVLRPGGLLLVVDYGGAERRGLMARHHLHRAFDLETLRPLLAQAGLAQSDAGPLGWLSLVYLVARKQAQPS